MADKMGIPFLRNYLNGILVTHIKSCIPSISQQINEEKKKTEAERRQFGDDGLDLNNFGACRN
jgi:hypothetical protein